MSKKPAPTKKQAVSSTRSRHATYMRKKRIKLQNGLVLDKCLDCGATKKRHYVCQECGKYKGRQVFEVQKMASPIQEVEA